MKRYRIWLYLANAWHVLDTFNTWPDAHAAFEACNRNNQLAVCVVLNSDADRSLYETGKLPPDVKRDIADQVHQTMARQRAANPNLGVN